MYWTHLIFALLHGLLIGWLEITASKPGYLDFDNLPETNFSCDGKVIGGYYADVETGCQMFHVCTIGQKAEVTDIKFLCLNGTVFDQETRVCERIDEVDCSKSEDFFGLNLELYGNNGNFGGIQSEGEFGGDCEEDSECSTDEEYEEEPTTIPSTSTTTSTTTTTTSTTTPRPTPRPYNADTIQALLALHSAFNKPPPPRVINNAFSPKPTTRRPPDLNLGYKSRYTPDSHSYGSLNLQQRERPYYFTPPTEKSNYHHFHSGDTSFGHSFDATRPYNFQYFHSRKIPADQASVSVVTSTSTSTSVKTSKGNTTEYPTGYEDYQDDISDHAFFEDVPRLRQKRELHSNHRYDNEEATTPRHKNHKYEDESTPNVTDDKEVFLQNLLGSIDLDDQVKEKMTDFFKKEDEEIDSTEKEGNSLISLGNKIGQVFTDGMNNSKKGEKQSNTNKILEWTKHLNDMNKDISLNHTFDVNFTDINHPARRKREAQKTSGASSAIQPLYNDERTQPLRRNNNTGKFRVESRRRTLVKSQFESKPVWEQIHDDFTTVEYRKSSKKGRSQPRSTTTLRSFTFNYELTTTIPMYDSKKPEMLNVKTMASKGITDFVHEGEGRVAYNDPIYRIEDTQGTMVKKFDQISHTDSLSASHQRSRMAVGKRTKLAEQTTESSPDYEVPRVSRPRQRPKLSRSRVREEGHAEFVRRKPELRASVESKEIHERGQKHPDLEGVTLKTTASQGNRSNRRRQPNVHRTTTVDYEELQTTPLPRLQIVPDPNFSCEGKVKGGFYADLYNDCRAFFICSQGAINGPLLKSHFLCGDKTKFNQRSRTCQAEDNVECEVSVRYFHLNNDFLVPVSEDELKGSFEPMKES